MLKTVDGKGTLFNLWFVIFIILQRLTEFPNHKRNLQGESELRWAMSVNG